MNKREFFTVVACTILALLCFFGIIYESGKESPEGRAARALHHQATPAASASVPASTDEHEHEYQYQQTSLLDPLNPASPLSPMHPASPLAW